MYCKGRLMSVFESILLGFNERANMIQFLVILPTVCRVDWIGCGSEYTELSWIGLDWVIKLLDWVGLDLAKWTHVQLWAGYAGGKISACCLVYSLELLSSQRCADNNQVTLSMFVARLLYFITPALF